MLRVLIADDSALVRETLATLINEDPDMMVAGVAVDGDEAVRKAAVHPAAVVPCTRHASTPAPTALSHL